MPDSVQSDEESDDAAIQALRSQVQLRVGQAVRRQWGIWAVRLAIGVAAVATTISFWPHLWWVALVYLPMPILSAIVLLRVGRKIEGRWHTD